MINTEFLHRLFPRADEIPLEHHTPAAIRQRMTRKNERPRSTRPLLVFCRRVLINGELRSWEGPCQTGTPCS